MQHALETLREHLAELKKALPAENNKDTVEMRASMLKGIEQHEVAIEVLQSFLPLNQCLQNVLDSYRGLAINANMHGAADAVATLLMEMAAPTSLLSRAKACE